MTLNRKILKDRLPEVDKDHSCVNHLWEFWDPKEGVNITKLMPPTTNFGWLVDMAKNLNLEPEVIEKLFSIIDEVNEDRSFRKNPFLRLYDECCASSFHVNMDEHIDKIEANLNRQLQQTGDWSKGSQEVRAMKQHLINVSEQRRVEFFLNDLKRQLISEYIELRHRQRENRISADKF